MLLGLLAAASALTLLARMLRNGSRTTLRTETIELKRLPASFDGTRIFFISDIHRRTVSDRLVHAVREAGGADLVLIGGDLRERGVPLARTRANLRQLAKLGPVYLAFGNHDYDDRVRELDVALREERVTALANDAVLLEQADGAAIRLAGVDDPVTGRDNLALALAAPDRPGDEAILTLLLAHSPVIADREDERLDEVDLILCGHTHGGQIVLPLVGPLLRTRTTTAYRRGWMKPGRSSRSRMFVSCGYGTSKLPLRLLAPAEAHLFTLRAQVDARRLAGVSAAREARSHPDQ